MIGVKFITLYLYASNLEMNGLDIDLVELGLSKIVVEPLLKILLKTILSGLKILNI
jgi:hypothetical protein